MRRSNTKINKKIILYLIQNIRYNRKKTNKSKQKTKKKTKQNKTKQNKI